jgi:hypothetical protein
MFDEETATTMDMWRQHNHLSLLLKIYEVGLVPADYDLWLIYTIKAEVKDYLDTYGREMGDNV